METGLILCAVDRTDVGTKVLDAAKATGGPVLMAHVANSLLDSTIPAFIADPETERVVAHGPTGPGLLTLAHARDASLIVLGSRGRLWHSVARYVAKRAHCPVMVVGPKADPTADPVTRPAFDRNVVRNASTPVVIAPSG